MYTISQAKKAIKDGIRGYLLKDEAGHYKMREENRIPFYMEGAPGIGKTEIVRQIADDMGIGYVSFSLVHHTRNSLLGLPVIEELAPGEKYTNYTMSEVIAKVKEEVANGHEEGILLLDEFPCMSETIMPIMLAFLQTKNIGTHRLPEGWVMVLCGNPPQYNRSSRKFDPAIMDRMRKLEIEYSCEDFLKYGKEIGVHEVIHSYLEMYPEHVYRYNNHKGETELVTCRSWENLSHALDSFEELEIGVEREMVHQFIKSDEIAGMFYDYYVQYQTGLSDEEFDSILVGKWDARTEEIYRKMELQQKLKSIKYIIDYLKKSDAACVDSFVQATKNSKATMKKMAKKVANLFEFINVIDPTGTLAENFFHEINCDCSLVVAMTEYPVEAYLQHCERKYASA